MQRLVLFLALLAAGCAEEGPVGPAGPEGRPGNANVQAIGFAYSDDTCLNMNRFVTCAQTWNAITPDVLAEGAVFGYLRNSDGSFTALPSTANVDLDRDGTYELQAEYGFTYSLGRVELRISLGGAVVETVGTGEVRFVALAGASGFSKGGVPPRYEALAAAFGLPR